MILSLLGLPEEDFPRMLKLTQEMFGGDDAEHQRGDSMEDLLAVLADYFAYFTALTASRREHPTDDLASAIANGRIDGEPLSDMDTVVLLRDRRQRRTRHHLGRDLGWPARAHPESR